MLLPFRLHVLVHYHKGGQEDELDADDEAQERKRVRVERLDSRHYPSVRSDPCGEEDSVRGNKPQTAKVPGNPVTNLLYPRAATVELLLQMGDGLYVFFG